MAVRETDHKYTRGLLRGVTGRRSCSPVRAQGISRLIAYIYSAASLSAHRNPVEYMMSVGAIGSRDMPSL